MRHHIGWIAILFLGALASAQSNKLKVYIAADMEGIGGVSTWEVQPTGNCYLPPVNGDLLQIMRWPFFQNMTDHDLRAIYEYLSAIPCNPGPGIADAPYLQNACE